MKKITIEFDDEDAERIMELLEKLMVLIEEQTKEEE